MRYWRRILGIMLIAVAIAVWFEPIAKHIPGWTQFLLLLVGFVLAISLSFARPKSVKKDDR